MKWIYWLWFVSVSVTPFRLSFGDRQKAKTPCRGWHGVVVSGLEIEHVNGVVVEIELAALIALCSTGVLVTKGILDLVQGSLCF